MRRPEVSKIKEAGVEVAPFRPLVMSKSSPDFIRE